MKQTNKRQRPRLVWPLALMLGLMAITPVWGDWVRVERASLTEEVRLDGRIEAVQQSTVSAQTSGTIVALPVAVLRFGQNLRDSLG